MNARKKSLYRYIGPAAAACAALAALLPGAAAASSLDYQLHGFAAQGLVLSDGNNVLGNSTGGSVAFNEFGLNGAVTL
ncbi:MAG TPA: hypothetical protein VHE37_02755, partial [Nevskiaceae bacterium]|nr:hypothetical protein [Nevskiaceae bacterium]